MANKQTKKSTNKQAKKNMNGIYIAIIALVAIVAVILAVKFLPGQTADSTAIPATISVKDAAERFEAGAFLLDVREQSEWDAGHVEGAVLIPLGQLESRISEIPADQDVLIICRSGNRSGQARDILRAAGLKRTTSISGGINAWISAGLPVVAGN